MKWLIILSLISIIAYWASPIKIAYTFDTSMPYHWWLEVLPYREPKVGDIVLIEPPQDRYTRGKLLVKRIVCAEGDHIQTKGLDYYCNGSFLGRARTTDSKGNPVNPVVLNQRIGKGYYFVMGDNERSYDSRYFGLVERERIKKLMFPLAKEPNLDFLFVR
ncbi:MAG: signal peptidase I [Aquificaceae bacterium]